MSDSPGRREVAHRMFAAEYDDATHEYSESDEERAPNYVVTPGGAQVNRLFVVGVLTAVEQVSDDVLRARIADPTGAFVVYAGQYQPDAAAFLESAQPPTFVALTGKARTFSPDDSDRVFTSVRPESINEVDAETRDRWVVDAAESTLARAATFAAALELDATGGQLRSALEDSGVDSTLAAGIAVARDHYGTTEHYLAGLADVARDALRLVADEVDEVDVSAVDPADPGDGVVDYRGIAEGVPRAVVDLQEPAAPTDSTSEPGDAATEPNDDPETVPSTTEPDRATDEDEAAGSPGAGDPAASEGDATEPEGSAAHEEDEPTTEADEATTEVGEATTEAGEATTEVGEAAAETDETQTEADEPSADTGTGPGEFDSDDVGDFEAGGDLGGGAADDTDDGSLDDADVDEPATAGSVDDEPPEDVLDDEERERIEAEYGTDFSTGTEVDGPGEAGIEPEAGDVEPSGDQVESGPADEQFDEDAAADDVDLDAALMERMEALDDGSGADREALVDTLADEYGVGEGAVEDAIQDALMAGKCFEPSDGKLQPI